jgi:hypothetical protein
MLILVIAGAESALASTWSTQFAPYPARAQEVALNGVSCTGGSACVAVGYFQLQKSEYSYPYTYTLVERWNGKRWSIQSSPRIVGSRFDAVSCISKASCVAVGFGVGGGAQCQHALAEHWNGATWTVMPTPYPWRCRSNDGSNITLAGISCVSSKACTAVGDIDRYQAQDAYGGLETHVPLAERWNGSRWSIQATTPNPDFGLRSGAYDEFTAVSCPTTADCTAAGFTEGGTTGLLEQWNGGPWVTEDIPNPFSVVELNGVSCTSSTACTAVGQGSGGATVAEQWNGSEWSIADTLNPPNVGEAPLNAIACTSSIMCVTVGDNSNAGVATTLAELWDGHEWSIEDTPDPAAPGSKYLPGLKDHRELHAVSCTSTTCIAVGSSGYRPLVEERIGT